MRMVIASQGGKGGHGFVSLDVPDIETILDIRPHIGYLTEISLIEGAFPEGMPEKRSEVRCPRAELPIRTRAALGPRSAGTRTGLHGACLTDG
jgi:hypothetical protein